MKGINKVQVPIKIDNIYHNEKEKKHIEYKPEEIRGKPDPNEIKAAQEKIQEIENAIKFLREQGLNDMSNKLLFKRDKMKSCIEKLSEGYRLDKVQMSEYYLYPSDVIGMSEKERLKSFLNRISRNNQSV